MINKQAFWRGKNRGSLVLALMLLCAVGVIISAYISKNNLRQTQARLKLRVLYAEKMSLWACHHAFKRLMDIANQDQIAMQVLPGHPSIQFYNTSSGKSLGTITSKGDQFISLQAPYTIKLPLEDKTDRLKVAYAILGDRDCGIPCNTREGGSRTPFAKALEEPCPNNYPEPNGWGQLRERLNNIHKEQCPLRCQNGFLPVLYQLQLSFQNDTITCLSTWWNPYDRVLEGNCTIALTPGLYANNGTPANGTNGTTTMLCIKAGKTYQHTLKISVNAKPNASLSNVNLSISNQTHTTNYNIPHISQGESYNFGLTPNDDFQNINLWGDSSMSISKTQNTPKWKKTKTNKIANPKSQYRQNPPSFEPQIVYQTHTPLQRIQASLGPHYERTMPYARIGNYLKTAVPYNQFFWDRYCWEGQDKYEHLNVNVLSDQWLPHLKQTFENLSLSTEQAETFLKILQANAAQCTPFLSVADFVQSGILQNSLKAIDVYKHLQQVDFLSYLQNPLSVRFEHFKILGLVKIKMGQRWMCKMCVMSVHRAIKDKHTRRWTIDHVYWTNPRENVSKQTTPF